MGLQLTLSHKRNFNTLRGKYTQALWPKKYMTCRTTGLLLVDKGEVEPGINIVKKILVNWLRQTEEGLHPQTEQFWEDYDVHTGQVRGPINYFRRIMKQLGWVDNTPTNITDHLNQTRNLEDWQGFVYDGIKRARQQAWEKSAKNKPNYKGMERGVDETHHS
eukprot:4801733-Heterocapsa_arctica.AAC.2